jgi:hypothetical protein
LKLDRRSLQATRGRPDRQDESFVLGPTGGRRRIDLVWLGQGDADNRAEQDQASPGAGEYDGKSEATRVPDGARDDHDRGATHDRGNQQRRWSGPSDKRGYDRADREPGSTRHQSTLINSRIFSIVDGPTT